MERMKIGQKYYFVENGRVYTEIESNHPLDDERFKNGNYYSTKEQALKK